MIQNHQKFRLKDKSKHNDLFVEVNWNPEDKDTNDCKVLKLTYPDGKEAFVDRKLFNEMLFAIGRPEDQVKMVPFKQIEVKWHNTILSVKATKNIKKGEEIIFPIKMSCSDFKERELIGLPKMEKPPTNLLLPK